MSQAASDHNSADAQSTFATESRQLVDHFFRHQSAKLVATLTRRFGVRHWELVEDVVQSALERALGSWSRNGVPPNPSAWLHRVAANLAIDRLRRDARSQELSPDIELLDASESISAPDDETIQDDLLRMMFACCDPVVPAESRIALALKTLCGFGDREIARALLSTPASIARRITRAKQRLRESDISLTDIDAAVIRERLPDVESVVYLLFNEGYSSSVADRLIREDLCEEAVRLALLLAEHPLTAGPDTSALLALLLFHAARLDARIDDQGAMLLLKEQDRSRWDRRLICEGLRWFHRAGEGDVITRYHAEAWIAAEHCRAASMDDIAWDRIARGYDLLCRIAPSPVHELNRAIAIGHRDGPDAGLAAFAAIDSDLLERDYYLWHATHADLARQTGDIETARKALQRARQLAPTQAEQELITRKLDHLEDDE